MFVDVNMSSVEAAAEPNLRLLLHFLVNLKNPNLFLFVPLYVTFLAAVVVTLSHSVCFGQEPDCLGFFHSLLH